MIETKRIQTPYGEELLYIGRIKVRELPEDISREEFQAWWPRLTEKERERYTAYESKNLIMTAGRNQILTYIGAASTGSLTPFAQYFAVGTTIIASVNPADTVVNGELFRAIPSTSTISGNTVDIATQFSTSQAVGTWTNCGIYGVNATSTSLSGTLMTHALFSYVKSNSQAVVCDYIIQLT